MKNTKKVLALFLALILSSSVFFMTVSAEESEDYEVVISEAKAVKLDENDPKCVYRLELVLSVSDETTTEFIYDTIDRDAEVMISEFSYVYRHAVVEELMGQNSFTDETVKKLCEEAEIAKAKAVSLVGNVLTVDIYSTDGKTGADMIEVNMTGFNDLDSKAFALKFPEKMFSNSETDEYSEEIYAKADVDGLEVVEVEAPFLVRVYFGDDAKFSLTVLLALPFLTFSTIIFAARYQNVCKIYGFNIFNEIKSLLNVIITQLKQHIN